ncbi:chaperone modulator CbpM [Dyadobacter tibetensis]|uniref:chaperone modulator CbpM n=1 Tax=Dyadobacter tibetensis TaxID=1211851 RepID=UPI0004709C1F|nr:chaperone modulator CbpM [Dyadobacter tibetensis]
MNTEPLISLDQLCSHYHIEMTFVSELSELGLLEIETVQRAAYIHSDQITHFERLIRLHRELDLNIEGIDITLQLLKRIEFLQKELSAVKNRLSLYEDLEG